MQYLLDTDTCIFLLRGKYNVRDRILEVGIDNCFISEITIAELRYGAEKSTNYEKHIKEVYKIERLFTVIPIYGIMDTFAREKVRLQKLGNLIPDFDLLIGTSAVANQYTLVTNNVKHMNRIQAVQIETWKLDT